MMSFLYLFLAYSFYIRNFNIVNWFFVYTRPLRKIGIIFWQSISIPFIFTKSKLDLFLLIAYNNHTSIWGSEINTSRNCPSE